MAVRKGFDSGLRDAIRQIAGRTANLAYDSIAHQGKQAQRENMIPAARQAHLQALAQKMVKAGGGKRTDVRVVLGDTGTFDEKPGQTLRPAAWAQPATGEIRMDAGPQLDPGATIAGPNGPIDDPYNARWKEQQQRGILAHEVGHQLEPELIRNYARARAWQDAHGIPMDPRAPVLNKSIAGRAELNVAPVQRDAWGMATQGLGGVHSAPNELYADDVRNAFGLAEGRMTPAGRAVLRALAQKRLIPQAQSFGLPEPTWHRR